MTSPKSLLQTPFEVEKAPDAEIYAYCTMNPGVPSLNWIQPDKSPRANCAKLEAYQRASSPAWSGVVLATTQYFTDFSSAGALRNLAAAKSQGAFGTVATAETSGAPGPNPQLSV